MALEWPIQTESEREPGAQANSGHQLNTQWRVHHGQLISHATWATCARARRIKDPNHEPLSPIG